MGSPCDVLCGEGPSCALSHRPRGDVDSNRSPRVKAVQGKRTQLHCVVRMKEEVQNCTLTGLSFTQDSQGTQCFVLLRGRRSQSLKQRELRAAICRRVGVRPAARLVPAPLRGAAAQSEVRAPPGNGPDAAGQGTDGGSPGRPLESFRCNT